MKALQELVPNANKVIHPTLVIIIFIYGGRWGWYVRRSLMAATRVKEFLYVSVRISRPGLEQCGESCVAKPPILFLL